MWHEFPGDFLRIVVFCVLRELFFAIRTDWFFLLGIKILRFPENTNTQH